MWLLSTAWLLPIATGYRQSDLPPFQSDSAVKHDIIKHISCVLLKEISIYEMTPDPGRALSLAICAYFVSFMVNCDDLSEFC